MRIIIAGSRTITDYNRIKEWLDHLILSGGQELEIVSGMAKGVDQLGERWANSLRLPVVKFSPDWDAHGKRAGFVRNELMAEYATELLAFWDGQSKGTQHMIQAMLNRNKPFQVILIK